MQNLLEDLTKLFSKEEKYSSEGRILKNVIIEDALKLEPLLIKLLLSDKKIKKHFFQDIEGTYIFDKIKFQKFISNKQFLPDSYTAFKNKIGLTTADEYITEKKDVVLSWPYKDCVLEGGQDKEDAKRDEIFWNETLAPDEIDRLLSPKVLTSWKKYDKDGEHKVEEISEKDNLIIKGNNLLGLSSILKKYRGKVKLICIDPPYNKGGDDFNYNDTFNHSSWLTFMKTRLETSFDLLDKNGSIFIFCDDNECFYLKVLCDSIFGRDRFISSIVWRNSDNSNNDAKQFSKDHNFILVYSKNVNWESINLERTEEQSKHYKNPDNDPKGPWFDGNPLNSPNPRKNLMFNLKAPNGNTIEHPPNGWRWDRETLKHKMDSGEIRYNSNQTNIIRRTYLRDQKGLPPSTLWEIVENINWLDLKDTGHTRQAKSEQKRYFPGIPTSKLFKTPKPEKVIKKIINISTNPGDIVLDFFAGSGTTASVAIKMNRQVITMEQMDYVDTFTVKRLERVVKGDDIGISKDVKWQGGGSFIFCELAKANQEYIDKINEAKEAKSLLKIWKTMQDKAFISYKVDIKTITASIAEFEELTFEDQKRFLIETLDKNMLYVPYSEIDDADYDISDEDKKLNHKFYGGKA
jgi:adenine-specific DNA-methyltransferase